MAFYWAPPIRRGSRRINPKELAGVLFGNWGRLIVKKPGLLQDSVDDKKTISTGSSAWFVFCQKSTGVAQFRALSNDDLDSSVERIAGQLAMQCLVRGHDPDDFVVLVPADGKIVGRFLSRAKELLEEGRAVTRPSSLSSRQSEILLSVIRNRPNKEIASKLNITVRTVKFHVSSLLNKFGVDNRAELARRATDFLRHDAADTGGPPFQPLTEVVAIPQLNPAPLECASRLRLEKPRPIGFSGRTTAR
jgi:DNA-binding CsgD family transcriptional regulator